MKVPLEEFVPYDQSVRYRIHDAYYLASGGESWSGGRIPYLASSNYAIARQHASLALEVVAELTRARRLKPREQVRVLEVGAGSGTFAANFLRALEQGTGEPGRRLLKRLRYVLSDMSRKAVQDAVAGAPLEPHVAAGRVVPALSDLARPDELVDLEGRPLDRPFTLVFANYLCCVTRLKMVKRTEEEYFERYARVEMEVGDDVPPEEATPEHLLAKLLEAPTAMDLMERHEVSLAWRPVKLPALLPAPHHAEILRRTLEPFREATIAYPHVFVDWLAGLRPRLVKGAAVFVSDYGHSDTEGLPEREGPTPVESA